jgi:hypothetical protein
MFVWRVSSLKWGRSENGQKNQTLMFVWLGFYSLKWGWDGKGQKSQTLYVCLACF